MRPTGSGWRWADGAGGVSAHTPWYPTARLFRPERGGEWAGVVERIRAALASHSTRLVARP
jgi:hypothetical protein